MTAAPSDLDPNTQAILDAVSATVTAVGDPQGIRVVDVGCGAGRLLSRLAALGVTDLTGVGWSIQTPPTAVAVAGTDLSATGWADRLDGRRYDWVTATEVLEHLVNPFQFLVELRRLVDDTGRLLLTFPNVHNWRSIVGYGLTGRFSGFFGPNFNDGHPLHDQHIFIPNLHLVRYFLKLAGFQIEAVRYLNGRTRLTAQTTLVVAAPCRPVTQP